MFNLAIDSKLRCFVALKVGDIAPVDAVDRATVWQKKTGNPSGSS
jgi:hypothetical protein